MLIKRGGPAALLACLVLSIAACGGGSGGGGGGGVAPLGLGTGTPAPGVPASPDPAAPGEAPVAVTFEGSLSGLFISGSNYSAPTPVLVKARLSRELSGTVYPVIVDAQQVLSTQYGNLAVTRGADGAYSVFLTPKVQTTPGVYAGKLQLKLCKDAACASEYQVTGGEFPYNLEFQPDVTLRAKINGVPVTGYNGFTSVTSGQTLQFVAAASAIVEVESNIPVTWTVGSAGTDRALSVTSQTDKSVIGTVTAGALGGSIDVKATPIDTRYKYYSSVMVLGQ